MGGGSSREDIVGATNELIATAFLGVTERCQTAVAALQEIKIECKGNPIGDEDFYEANTTCVACWRNVLRRQETRYALIRAQWDPDKGRAPVNFDINTDFDLMYSELNGCLGRCKACVFENFNQVDNYSFDSKCNFNTQEVNDFTNSVQSSITQALTDNEDVLSSIAMTLGAGDKQSVVANIMNRLKVNFNVNFLSTLVNRVSAIQSITVTGSGQTIDGATQTSLLSGAASAVASTGITNDVLNDQQWAIYQKLYNSENTLGELGNIVKKTVLTLGDITETLTGKILVASCVLLGLVVVFVAALAIYNAVKKRKEGQAAARQGFQRLS